MVIRLAAAILLSLFALALCSEQSNQPLSLKILHTNDIHAHFDEFNSRFAECSASDHASGNCFGGYARIVAAVNQMRNSHSNTLLLDAGDYLTGTLFHKHYNGVLSAYMINKLQYDAITVGNHEFDMGPPALGDFFAHVDKSIPVVVSNLDASHYPELEKRFVKSHVIEKYGIAIVGGVTEETPSMCRNVQQMVFNEVLSAVQNEVDKLVAKGHDRIIFLSHNGFQRDIALAQRLQGVDLIIGGHSHSLLLNEPDNPRVVGRYPTVVLNEWDEPVYIVQANQYGKFLGNIDLIFDDEGKIRHAEGNPILLGPQIAQDIETQRQINRWKEPFKAESQKIIGTALAKFEYPCDKFDVECATGNLVSDCILWGSPEADIAIMNGDGIRAGLDAGLVRNENIHDMLPIENEVVQIHMTGQQILEMFEDGFAGANFITGKKIRSKLQFSGARIVVDMSKPTHDRVISVQILDKDSGRFHRVQRGRTYRVALTSFIAEGGDNMIQENTDWKVLHESVTDLMKDYVRHHRDLSPDVGRIRYL